MMPCWQVPVDAAPTGKRVLVVGAGPSGLSAACHLTRKSIRRSLFTKDLRSAGISTPHSFSTQVRLARPRRSWASEEHMMKRCG